MFHLATTVLWLLVYVFMTAYLPQYQTGANFALFLAVYNLLRGAVRGIGAWRRRRAERPEVPELAESPPPPVVHPEFRFDDHPPADGGNR